MPIRMAAVLALLCCPLAARAGVAIGESIWDQQNAIERATQMIPSGALVTATECTTVEVGTGNDHYICRLTYSDPPANAPTLAPASAPSQPLNPTR